MAENLSDNDEPTDHWPPDRHSINEYQAQVEWDDLKSAADYLFGVWTNSGELAWAEQAWKHFRQAGLTSATNELERHRTLLRFLALPRFYRRWTREADQLQCEDHYFGAEKLDLSPFVLGQLLGSEVEIDADTEHGKVYEALEHLVPTFHREVTQALLNGFGGQSVYGREAGLFLSLWRIRYPAPKPNTPASGDEEEEEYEHYREDDYEVVNYMTTDKLCGYEWITNGCPD